MKCLSVWCKQKVSTTWIHINHRLNYHRFCQYMPDTDSFTCTFNACLFWVQLNPDKCIYLVSEAFPVCSFFLFKWIFFLNMIENWFLRVLDFSLKPIDIVIDFCQLYQCRRGDICILSIEITTSELLTEVI